MRLGFVHIPKTAGISILSTLDMKFESHRRWDYFKRIQNKDYLFTVIRNPYDKFMSALFYAKQKEEKRIPKTQKRPFYYHPDHLLFKDKSIKECVKLLKNPEQLLCITFYHQYPFIYMDGEFKVDKILRYERLQEDFNKMMYEIKFPHKELIKDNATERKSWESYLDEEDKEIIYNHYRRDFEILGYER